MQHWATKDQWIPRESASARVSRDEKRLYLPPSYRSSITNLLFDFRPWFVAKGLGGGSFSLALFSGNNRIEYAKEYVQGLLTHELPCASSTGVISAALTSSTPGP